MRAGPLPPPKPSPRDAARELVDALCEQFHNDDGHGMGHSEGKTITWVNVGFLIIAPAAIVIAVVIITALLQGVFVSLGV